MAEDCAATLAKSVRCTTSRKCEEMGYELTRQGSRSQQPARQTFSASSLSSSAYNAVLHQKGLYGCMAKDLFLMKCIYSVGTDCMMHAQGSRTVAIVLPVVTF